MRASAEYECARTQALVGPWVQIGEVICVSVRSHLHLHTEYKLTRARVYVRVLVRMIRWLIPFLYTLSDSASLDLALGTRVENGFWRIMRLVIFALHAERQSGTMAHLCQSIFEIWIMNSLKKKKKVRGIIECTMCTYSNNKKDSLVIIKYQVSIKFHSFISIYRDVNLHKHPGSTNYHSNSYNLLIHSLFVHSRLP